MLWVITTVVFVMFFVAPTHVAQLIAGRQATPETVALVAHRLGLDRPVPHAVRATSSGSSLHGDLGYSYYNSTAGHRPIGQRVSGDRVARARRGRALAPDRRLARACWPRRGRARRPTARSPAALFFYSMPTFLLGLLLLYFLFFRLTLAGCDLFPGSGYVAVHPGPARVGAAPDPAVAHARAGDGRDLHAADAGLDARRAGRGLHPHRPRQGHARAAGDLPARAAQRAHADRHPVRHRPGHAARRRDHHREGVRAARPRGSRRAVGRAAGSARDHRHGDARGGLIVVIEHRRRLVYALLDPRVRAH